MTKEIIEKWYKKLHISESYDKEFYMALDTYEIDTSVTVEEYNSSEEDGKKNLLYFLYFCEEVQRKYTEKGINENILLDTLQDIPRWLDIWADLKGNLFLGELEWLKNHMELKLFKLGRLQFCFADDYEFQKRGIKKGDAVIDTHIPADGPLLLEECKKSFEYAREFFEKYYPEYKYEIFTCHSWLLDENMTNLLDDNSNIVKFQKLFTIEEQHESDAILGYVFRWRIKRDELFDVEPISAFARKLKAIALNGAVFYEGTGYINK